MFIQRIIRQVKNSSPFIGWMYTYIFFGGFILLLIPKTYIHLFINQYHSPVADIFFTYATFLGDGISATILVVILLFVRFRYASMVALSNIACSLLFNHLRDYFIPIRFGLTSFLKGFIHSTWFPV